MRLINSVCCGAVSCCLALAFFFSSAVGAAPAAQSEPAAVNTRPNVLIIVADDLGFTDIGAFGGFDIATPNLDALAHSGLRLSNFHTLPTCAPTRAVLLTGVDNHIAGIGSQVIADAQRGQPGYEGYLSDRVATIAEILGENGYRTYHSGKWHLGASPEHGPMTRGFQDAFALLPGGASHFADGRPLHPGEPTIYLDNDERVAALPADFYSTRYYTDRLVDWLMRDAHHQAPFFAYLAYTAPHDPLHAPSDYIAKYQGRYDEGYEVLRAQRFAALKVRGIIAETQTLPPWPWFIPRWAALTEQQRAISRRDMEIYAAMIDYMDEQIGRVLNLLRAQNRLDNTLILFMSDNGANGAPVKVYPEHTREFHAGFDNSLSNRGASGSFVSTGAGWATASTAAFRRFKFFLNEGGIRTIAMIKPPNAVNTGVAHEFTHVRDILPTVLDLTGLTHPATGNKHLVLPQGRSLMPLLIGRAKALAPLQPVGYEVHGARAYIDGDWKALQVPIGLGSGQWLLFNLANDPAELTNVGSEYPKLLANMREAQRQYERNSGVIYSPPKAVAVGTRLFYILLALAAGLALWLSQAQFSEGQPRGLMLLLAMLKLALFAGLLSAWREWALQTLLALTLLEILLHWRQIRRWPFLIARLVLPILLLAALGLARGMGIMLFLQEY